MKEKLKLRLLDLREKSNLKLIVLSKKLPKLSISRELRLKKLSVRSKWLSIRKNLKLEELREKLKWPVTKLSKNQDMLHSELSRNRERHRSELTWS